MSAIESLDDYTAACTRCDRRRYVTSRKGDVAFAEVCPECMATCPACNGEEYRYERDARGYRYVRDCPVCAAVRFRTRAFNDAGIPAHYHGVQATLEAFQTHEGRPPGQKNLAVGNLLDVKKHIYAWAKGFVPGERGFLLHGAVGTGKTHLLAATIRYLTLEKGIAARFVEYSHLLGSLKEQFDQGRGESALLAPLINAPVLGVDELGKQTNTEWQLSILDAIISKRYNRGLTTLFTTNLSPEGAGHPGGDASGADFRRLAMAESLRDRVGERIYSRLMEMAVFVPIQAPDYRANKARARSLPPGP